MENRKSTKSVEIAVKEAEKMLAGSSDLDDLNICLSKTAEGMQFHEAKLSIFSKNGKLGTDINDSNLSIGKIISWRDPEQSGYFSRDKEFVVEFQIAGRNYTYGKNPISLYGWA